MDAELAVLAGTAGTTLVTLLTTEAWQRVSDGVASLWRRAEPERAEAISTELEVTRADLLAPASSRTAAVPPETITP
ncbi:hypothetical protein [Streptomyces sp. NBC_00691]|uniref:hypothetical protein n=1 Tax=Streptomyces sp. NBC_00691 TaxID=2903671 RepID=UPI002E338656|nr:hypothetical protein [Streptomyces sp. NBC_00691]